MLDTATRCSLICLWSILSASSALAQAYPVPFELSGGMGVLRDRRLSGVSPTLVGGLSWDYDENWWMVFIVEGELNGASEAAPCRRSGNLPDYCYDAAVLAGFRFRQTPHSVSGAKPFANFLLGSYWKGSGTDETTEGQNQEFSSDHFAMQIGGGVEIRWPGSFQGVRVAVDFRRVLEGDRHRNQLRLMGTYVIGPRRYKGQ